MNCNVEKHPISNYWAAVILADKFSDADFKPYGVNFSNCSGRDLLTAIEQMFGAVRPPKTKKLKTALPDADYVRLMAFMGSRGVKTSALATSDDIWQAVTILWPSINRGTDLANLVSQISGFSKAKRKTANANVKNLPKNWIA